MRACLNAKGTASAVIYSLYLSRDEMSVVSVLPVEGKEIVCFLALKYVV